MLDTKEALIIERKLAKQLEDCTNLLDAFKHIEPIVLEAFDATRVSIFQRRAQQHDLVARIKTGKENREIRVPISPQSIAGYVAMAQKAIIVDDPYNDEQLRNIHPKLHFDKQFDLKNQFVTNNILCIPVMNGGVVLGVMQIINKKRGTFNDTDLQTATKISNLIGTQFRYELGGTVNPFDYLVHRGLIDYSEAEELSDIDNIKTLIQKLNSELRVSEDDIGRSLAMHYQVPYIQYLPDEYHLHPKNNKLNLSYLKRNFVAVIADAHERPTVLMAQPNHASLLMEIESALGIDSYDIAIGLPKHILQYLGENAGGGNAGELDDILDEIGTSSEEDEEQIDDLAEDAPAVVRLVSTVLHDAKRLSASDIHIDPEKGAPTRVRMRVDGVVRDINQIPASHHNAVVARIKIMSSLNIAEKRIPQDGKLAFRMSGQSVEVRVATIPTVAGEGVVMRILATGGAMQIEKMNLSPNNYRSLERMIKKPHGILLVVGPTGSGKTTTLHAVLGHLNTPDKKIWTAEDPVEITQAGLQQVQVSPKIGFTFANALRAFLRADPDIILIGEMRDQETAHAGIEASLTGHMVLSTLHTNSAPETITRLLDLGIDPVNFSDACVGILAQRLIRTLCKSCKQSVPATPNEIKFLKRQYGEQLFDELELSDTPTICKAKGCKDCGDTGYKGRTGVHELLSMTDALRAMIYKQHSVNDMREQAMQDGMRTLLQDAVLKVLKGDTDIAQVQSLSGH